MSDKYGRRFAYQFNLAVFGVVSVAATFAPSMSWLIAGRFIMGIGLGAELVMGYGLITEFVPPQRRGRYLALMGVLSGAGVFAPSILSTVIIPYLGWRPMFAIGGLGTLWVWWLRRHLPESPRWLERVGRTVEAEEVMQAIEKEAGITTAYTPGKDSISEEQKWVPLSVLFTRPVIRRTLLAISCNVVCLFGSYSLTAWLPTFFVKGGMSVSHSLLSSAAMMSGWIFGPVILIFLSDRLGRRWGLVLFGVVCGTFAIAYPFFTSSSLIIVCGCLLVTAVSIFSSLALGTGPELFPTEYRFRGGGFAQMIGRIGLIGSPFIIMGLFNQYGISGVVYTIAGLYIGVALIMAVAGIETNQRSLEALAPDASDDPQAAEVPHTAPLR
jgi:putative MFS transporter